MKKIFLIAIFLSTLFAAAIENAIIVRSFPDGYKDNGRGSIFSDAPSVIILYTWAAEKGFMGEDVRLLLSLPENLEITRFSVTNRPRNRESIVKKKTEDGRTTYEICAGKIPFTTVYKLSKHAWRPTVPMTESALIFFVKPGNGLPEEFTVDWKITGKNITGASGCMKLNAMKVPKLKYQPKNITVWSSIGVFRDAWDMENLTAHLKVLRDAGITGILETGGQWFPEKLIRIADLPRYGLNENIAMQVFNYSQRKEIADMQAAGFGVTEKDCVIDAGGTRQIRNKGPRSYPLNIYCITKIGQKDSLVRAYMRQFYGNYIKRGFRFFFTDYEPSPYDNCYCETCREEYAAFSSFDKEECLKLSPGELVAKDPWKWYKFRCFTYARVLDLLRKELGVKIGWNSNLGSESAWLPDLNSYGMVSFAEDPRLFDACVDFHDADILGTELSSVYALESFLQKRTDGKFALQKPVIARATSLHWVNWGYFCIYGRKDFGIKKGFRGLGVDFRRMLHRLEIAQDLAIGAKGVEITANIFNTDAEALTGIVEGLDYGGEFEPYLSKESRIDRRKISLWDSAPVSDALEQEMKKGYISNWFLSYHKKFKSGQIVGHAGKKYALFTIFNWNYFEKMEASFRSEIFPEGKYYAHISCNGEHFSLPGVFDAKTVRDQGVFLTVPPGSFASVLFVKERKYPARVLKAHSGKPRLIEPFINGIPDEGTKPFYRNYNSIMKALQKKYPAAGFREVPVR